MTPEPLRFALIGHGHIGATVARAWRAGALPGWTLASVLVRHTPTPADAEAGLTQTLSQFLASQPDVIIEAAGPEALRAHGEAALSVAPVWTVSAAALADAALYQCLAQTAQRSGHRLRVLPGALAGLDGVAMAATDAHCQLHLEVELRPDAQPAADLFQGSVRDAAVRFPGSVNVAAAAALAGPGLDASTIAVRRPGPVPTNRLALHARSALGEVWAQTRPRVADGAHPVAACIVAALRQQLQPIWVG